MLSSIENTSKLQEDVKWVHHQFHQIFFTLLTTIVASGTGNNSGLYLPFIDKEQLESSLKSSDYLEFMQMLYETQMFMSLVNRMSGRSIAEGHFDVKELCCIEDDTITNSDIILIPDAVLHTIMPIERK